MIADTWAHQDHCGLDNVMNTYWDADYDPDSWEWSKMGYGPQAIYYMDGSSKNWNRKVLKSSDTKGVPFANPNFEAAPSGTSYLGHGWLRHFPTTVSPSSGTSLAGPTPSRWSSAITPRNMNPPGSS